MNYQNESQARTDKFLSIIDQLSDTKNNKLISHINNKKVKLPSIQNLQEMMELLREIFFPSYFTNSSISSDTLKFYLGVQIDKVKNILYHEIYSGLCFSGQSNENNHHCNYEILALKLVYLFIEKLTDIRDELYTDVEATFNGDPASDSISEIIFCYPGIKAMINYRIANALYKLNIPLIPRILTEMAHSETGIDINPEAQIGKYFMIDHGTGVVIGATSIIGDNVRIYQGVTLGAKSFPVDENGNPIKGIPRHPILEDNVIIYSGATVLGRITIGNNSVIGGNVWVTSDLPAYSKIIQSKTVESSFSEGGGI